MNQNRRQNLQDMLVFALLVGIGVAGRWGQPLWAFTPIAATAIFAGFYFTRFAIAAMVPVAILAISDLALPAYDSVEVMICTYAAMMLPVWLGRTLRGEQRIGAIVLKSALCGFVPATVFFIVSNFAVWAFKSNYAKTLAGLVECYWAAVPFYRWMLAGDLFYLGILAACWFAARLASNATPGIRQLETSRA